MKTLLAAKAPQLVVHIATASFTRQRAACLAAVKLALQSSFVNDPAVSRIIDALHRQGSVPPQESKDVRDLAGRLDDAYCALLGKRESAPNLRVEALKLYSQARAVTALAFASSAQTTEAILEAVYEASTAVKDSGKVFDVALMALRR